MLHSLPNALRWLLLAAVVVLALYPLYGGWLLGEKETFFLQKLTTMMILAIFAMSLDLLVGVTGLVSLGHALFFGLSGYVLALTAPAYEAASLWLTLPLSLAASAAAALVIGLLSIRTSGIYFIMVTLAFGQMFFYFFNDSALAGGSDGLYIYFKPEVKLAGFELLDLEDKQNFFYLALGAMVGVYLFLRILLRSPFGQVLQGIHANEHRIRALGYNATAFKLVSFVIAGTLAGLAGFLAAAQFGFVNPSNLHWHASGSALMMVIMGGMGTLFGPALGAFAFELLHYVYEDLTEHWLLLMGLTVISMVLFLPKGLGGLLLVLTAPKAKSPLPARGGLKPKLVNPKEIGR
ncbi:MAG TPA: branched-chain amino acid ABC transporter permease [Candidatus Competibacteraceae bacterium]|nr:branched-chain amino acid ABC transporter permease [Candidatus Competibacteraceae bacterium]